MHRSESAAVGGALVISLDFELQWGARTIALKPGASYRPNLLGAREAIPRILSLFESFEIAATWATVGFLFAHTREERERFSPSERARYLDPRCSSYAEETGDNEADDPLHYAPSLIRLIRDTPRQEVGTHTYAHYFCLEPGHDRESFRADLQSALAIASGFGIRPRSIVFPRNQHNPDYDDLLREAGIRCYRGQPRSRIYRVDRPDHNARRIRALRLADSYARVAGSHRVGWGEILQESGLCDVPASFLIRGYSRREQLLEPLRLRRIVRSMQEAAASGTIVHLWWHPHNFGVRTSECLDFLRRILDTFARLRECDGMRSLSMLQVADIVTGGGPHAPSARFVYEHV